MKNESFLPFLNDENIKHLYAVILNTKKKKRCLRILKKYFEEKFSVHKSIKLMHTK